MHLALPLPNADWLACVAGVASGNPTQALRPVLRRDPRINGATCEHRSPMGYLFLALALVLNATANILLKIGAARLGGLDEPNLVGRFITNYHLLAGLSLFALNVAFYILALTRLNLSVAYPIMMAGGVVIIVAVSVLLLHEALTIRQAVGLFLLITGIVLVAERSTA
jgi:multidrug transporter EmrE-like cation transporter